MMHLRSLLVGNNVIDSRYVYFMSCQSMKFSLDLKFPDRNVSTFHGCNYIFIYCGLFFSTSVVSFIFIVCSWGARIRKK